MAVSRHTPVTQLLVGGQAPPAEPLARLLLLLGHAHARRPEGLQLLHVQCGQLIWLVWAGCSHHAFAFVLLSRIAGESRVTADVDTVGTETLSFQFLAEIVLFTVCCVDEAGHAGPALVVVVNEGVVAQLLPLHLFITHSFHTALGICKLIFTP